MLLMPSKIDIYQEMSTLSASMVEAARVHDWDRLVTLEQSVSSLRDTLTAEGDGDIPAGERELIAVMIQRILDDDAEIRRHTEPWMEHVRQYLCDGARKRQIERAYGGNSP